MTANNKEVKAKSSRKVRLSDLISVHLLFQCRKLSRNCENRHQAHTPLSPPLTHQSVEVVKGAEYEYGTTFGTSIYCYSPLTGNPSALSRPHVSQTGSAHATRDPL